MFYAPLLLKLCFELVSHAGPLNKVEQFSTLLIDAAHTFSPFQLAWLTTRGALLRLGIDGRGAEHTNGLRVGRIEFHQDELDEAIGAKQRRQSRVRNARCVPGNRCCGRVFVAVTGFSFFWRDDGLPPDSREKEARQPRSARP
jgi:hypothetical protein